MFAKYYVYAVLISLFLNTKLDAYKCFSYTDEQVDEDEPLNRRLPQPTPPRPGESRKLLFKVMNFIVRVSLLFVL